MAFTRPDFTFEDKAEKSSAYIKKKYLTRIGIMKARWRIHKNGDNRQEITIYADKKNEDICPYRAAGRIVKQNIRFKRNKHSPIGVYKNTKGDIRYAMPNKMETLFVRIHRSRITE